MGFKKILVVDDEDDILQLLYKNLSARGYQVITAQRGKEAIEKTKTNLPNLILMDIMMPDIDGAETVKILQEDPAIGSIPIIFLSGIASKEEGTSAAEVKVGGSSFPAIPKPFEFDELLKEVQKALKD